MYLPSIFSNDFEDLMEFPFRSMEKSLNGREPIAFMRTDIKDLGESYELSVELPGYKKDEVDIRLEKGTLSITATRHAETDESDQGGKYIRRERYYGSMKRSFYVGDGLTVHDIKAKYTGGILELNIPKKPRSEIETSQKIAIE